jgi:hypothetical protein
MIAAKIMGGKIWLTSFQCLFFPFAAMPTILPADTSLSIHSHAM